MNALERKPLLALLFIFLTSLTLLMLVYINFPHLEDEEKLHMKLPRNIEDAKKLGLVLSRYKEKYYFTVLTGVFITYIFLQSFAIPGSIFLSIMSGYLFSFPIALTLICTCSALGASICYLLSYLLGRKLVLQYFREKVEHWSAQVVKHKEHMLNYIIFLRITPILPNWFINLTSPVIQVPFWPFCFGTFLGVAPPSFVAIQAGTTLQKLTSSSDAVSWNSMIVLGVLAIGSLLPVFFKKSLKNHLE